MSDAAERSSRLTALLEEWFTALEAGRVPDPDVLCRDVPELLEDFHRIVSQDESTASALRAISATTPEIGGGAALPERLGEYRIERHLASGGMGDVYLATQESLGRQVALKVLRADVGADAQSLLRFRREAEIAAALDHPHVVPIHAIGEDAGRAWLAMKWLQGPGLDCLPERLPPREIARLGAAIADALHEAHLSGVIHRDVKPANVILDAGVPYVVDFGLARVHQAASLTREGNVAGTLAYMSPEQLKGGRHALDPRTDVYSLGATLYELAAGHPPFPQTDPEALMTAVMLEAPPELGLTGAGRDLETVLRRALEKERERRFFSAAELGDELGRIARGEPILSRRVGVLGRFGRRLARHPRVSAAIGLLLVSTVTASALGFSAMKRREDRFLSGVRAVRRATEDGRLVLARSLLSGLEETDPERDELRRLARDIAAREALESLLDLVQDRQELGTLANLRRQLDETLRLGGARFGPRVVGVISCLLDILEGDAAAARQRLQSLGEGRDAAALRCLLEPAATWAAPSTTDPAVLSPGERRRRADEHVLADVVLRLADRSLAEREAEIARARELVEDHYRAANARAVLLAERERHRQAHEAFGGLLLTGRARPPVHRNLGRLAMILGDLDEAARRLERVGRRDAGPVQSLLEADLAERGGDPAAADRRLDQALDRHPEDPQLLLARARRRALRGDVVPAREDLEHAARTADFEVLRKDVSLSRFFLDLLQLPGADRVRPLADASRQREAIHALITRAERLSAALSSPGQRAELLGAKARLERLAGRLSASWASLDAALVADPDCPQVSSLIAAIALQAALDARNRRDLHPEDRQWAGDWNLLFAAGLDHAERLRSLRGRGMRPPTRAELRDALLASSYLALALRREALAEERILEALDVLEDVDTLQARQWRPLLQRMLDGLGSR